MSWGINVFRFASMVRSFKSKNCLIFYLTSVFLYWRLKYWKK